MPLSRLLPTFQMEWLDTGKVKDVSAGTTNNSMADFFFGISVPLYCLHMSHLPLTQLTNKNCANQMVTFPSMTDLVY